MLSKPSTKPSKIAGSSSSPNFRILPSQREHAEFIISEILAKKITHLKLSTFGLWAGINNDGSPSKISRENPAQKVLDIAQAEGIHVEIIIGIPPFSSRSGFNLPPCLYCADQHRRMLQRLFQSRKTWKAFHWFFHPANHTKLAIGLKNENPCWSVVGGHNLADSDLEDFSIILPETGGPFLDLFERLKEASDPDISEIRMAFEASVQDAAVPLEPANKVTRDGTPAKQGIFQPLPPGKAPVKPFPPAEELIDFLYAISKKRYLEREHFTQVARSSAWVVNQVTGELNPQAIEHYKDNPGVAEAALVYKSTKSESEEDFG